jgi:hypothetical protein
VTAGRAFRRTAPLLAIGLHGLPTRAAPPELAPEGDLDRPSLTGALGDQTVPAVAFSGATALVLWRNPLWNGEVRAARVTEQGVLGDPRGVGVPGLAGSDGRLALAAGPDGFLIAAVGEPHRLHAVRVPAGEAPIQPQVTAVAEVSTEDGLEHPAVAWNGSSFWVAWSRVGPGRGVYATRVGSDGVPLDPLPRRLSPEPGFPALASDGKQTLALWTAARSDGTLEVRGLGLGADGQLLEAESGPVLALPGQRAAGLALAAGNGQFLVAAAGESSDGASTITGVRLDAAGRPLDSALMIAARTGGPGTGPAVVWTGSRFLVAWDEAFRDGARRSSRALVRPVMVDGTAGPAEALAEGAAAQPAMAFGAEAGLALFGQVASWDGAGLPADLDLRGRALLPAGPAGPSFLVSAGPGWQGTPALASSGDRLLAAWEDRRDDRTQGDVYAALVGPQPAEPIRLATGDRVQHAPVAAWDGQQYLVVWNEGSRGLRAARVDPDGTPLDPEPAVVPGSAEQRALADPVVCRSGGGILLIWSRLPTLPSSANRRSELRGLRLPAGGTFAEARSFLLAATYDDRDTPLLALSCNADADLLAWTGLHETARRVDLHIGRLLRGESGLAGGAPEVVERAVALEPPAVTTDGRRFLLAWRRVASNGARTEVVGARLDGSGRPVERAPVPLGTVNAGQRLRLYWDGQQYVLLGIQALDIHEVALRARRLDADLRLADAAWFPVATLASLRGTGTLADAMPLGPARALVAYEQFSGDDITTNQRLRTRVLTTPPLDPAEAVALETLPASPDAAAPDAGTATPAGDGCSCRAGGRSSPAPTAIIAVVLAALGRRRGGRRPRPGV